MAAALHSSTQDPYGKFVFSEERSLKALVKSNKFMAVAAFFALLILAIGVVAPQQSFAQESERKVKVRVNPTYPELAKQTRISGAVKLEAIIAPSGQVKSVKVIGGHPLLTAAAEDAMKKWKYEPSSSESTAIVEFKFNPGM